jgi:anaerobic ribonucleoside-triphosphate reductase activating protein
MVDGERRLRPREPKDGMKASELRVAAYLPSSRANGPGRRSVLWVQGCPLRCPGCFNPDFLPFAGGRAVPVAEVAGWMLAERDTEGVSFSGGEPFAQAAGLAEVAERVRAAGKGVLVFTGFTAAALRARRSAGIRRLLAASDLLVAGPYRREAPTRHALLVSANQELVFLTERYRGMDLGVRRTEFRIGADGAVTVTGFPARLGEGNELEEMPWPCRTI